MTICGAGDGLSQRRTRRSRRRGRLTQPFVDLRTRTCRKIPDPRPGTIGFRLNPTTARNSYARGLFDMSGVVTLNGGLTPHPVRWNRL
jgi:hypothetical protein